MPTTSPSNQKAVDDVCEDENGDTSGGGGGRLKALGAGGGKEKYKRVPSSSLDTSEHREEEKDENDHLLNSMDVEDARGSKKKTKRKFERNPSENSCLLIGSWLCLILILGTIILGLNFWRKHEHNLRSNSPTNDKSSKSSSHSSGDDDDDDDDGFRKNSDDNKATFYFDPFAAVQTANPLDMAKDAVKDYYATTFVPPVWEPFQDVTADDPDDRLGYMMQPDTVNGTVVFVSEGDMYWTSWKNPQPDFTSSLPAMKLTTTVGNVRNPKINPVYPYLIAYTATYTARRDVYLLDLRRRTHGKQPAMRLTYWAESFGVRALVGWKDDGKTLVFQAYSNTVSLPDYRMYELTLAISPEQKPRKQQASQVSALDKNNTNIDIQHPQVLQLNPVPLAQALEGAYHDHQDCWYFTRFQQSSYTARYQGGTAESIWAWCNGHELAVALTIHEFNGTSKAPSIFTMEDSQKQRLHYLLFLSDRGPNPDPSDRNKWKATTMNLWAVPLPEAEDLSALANPGANSTVIPSFNPSQFIQLTQVACEFGGMPLIEYSLDPISQNVVLRIGADLFWMSVETIRRKLLHPATRQRHLDKTNGPATPNETTGAVAAKAPQKTKAKGSADIHNLGILAYSDFHEHQERLIPFSVSDHLGSADIYETTFGSLSFLFNPRGQVWVAPVADSVDLLETTYMGAGRNIPLRRYRVAPGSKMDGAVRVLSCRHVPMPIRDGKSARRLAVILATDPKSPTAEHAFYLIETQSDATPSFISMDQLPDPFVGGHKGGGSTRDGGLGSVLAFSVSVSPCGRRLAWIDTDGRICVMTLPLYKETAEEYGDYNVLPRNNERGEPMVGPDAELKWSPGGRYLAVEHIARNQFSVISIVDCGDPLMPGSEATSVDSDPKAAGINITRIVQATPDRFNSNSPYWGMSSYDRNYFSESSKLAEVYGGDPETELATTTLYFLTDRDILNEQSSPWGTRAPSPYFKKESTVYALPLIAQEHKDDTYSGHFSGGGAEELFVEKMLYVKSKSKEGKDRALTVAPSQAPTFADPEDQFPQDPAIAFGPPDLTFARRAYRLATVPIGNYQSIVSQANDDSSILLVEKKDDDMFLKFYAAKDFPSDKMEETEVEEKVSHYGLSTSRNHLYIVFDGKVKVVPNTASGFSSLATDAKDLKESIVFTEDMAISVWPGLEYQQLYADAWRMMRDYFYDPDMTGIDWYRMYERYLPLVRRCAKREELDDVLEQMASEVSALHVFVYGGEYSTPFGDSPEKTSAHIPATFGITVERAAEWSGFRITSIPEIDPDFSMTDREETYSPLSERTLRMSGQVGLKVGDVIVAINGESVMNMPDISMFLRGMQHQSVRLDVLRLASSPVANGTAVKAEPVIAVPISPSDDLNYYAWEWKTRQMAKTLAEAAGFSIGYIHLRSMSSPEDEDAFARGFFPDYDKEAMIVDVRHNRGGNIDSWLLDVLQRKAWMYWQGR
jgi:hypothetical protein